jgi:ribosomal protein S18 acetylase RimI-like enzyme
VAVANIRRYQSSDRDWVIAVAAEVYGDLGDYAAIIPPWLDHPGVMGWVAETDGATAIARGFCLLGFYAVDDGRGAIAELVALAVAPPFQGNGIGRALLDHAIAMAEQACHRVERAEMRLTVAADNSVGLHLYETTGFELIDGDHGTYDQGQAAIRMARQLTLRG